MPYNVIYKELVEDPDDIQGIIAYALYKKSKIAYVESYEREHGQPPDEQTMKEHRRSCRPNLQIYKDNALQIMHRFAEVMLGNEIREIEEKFANDYRKKIQNLKPSWTHSIISSFIGAVAFAVFVGAIIFIIFGFRQGFSSTLEQIIKDFNTSPIGSEEILPPQSVLHAELESHQIEQLVDDCPLPCLKCKLEEPVIRSCAGGLGIQIMAKVR